MPVAMACIHINTCQTHYKVWKCGKKSTAANSGVGAFASAEGGGEGSALGGAWVDLEMEQVEGYLNVQHQGSYSTPARQTTKPLALLNMPAQQSVQFLHAYHA